MKLPGSPSMVAKWTQKLFSSLPRLPFLSDASQSVSHSSTAVRGLPVQCFRLHTRTCAWFTYANSLTIPSHAELHSPSQLQRSGKMQKNKVAVARCSFSNSLIITSIILSVCFLSPTDESNCMRIPNSFLKSLADQVHIGRHGGAAVSGVASLWEGLNPLTDLYVKEVCMLFSHNPNTCMIG